MTERISVTQQDGTAVIRLGTDGHIFLTAQLCDELEVALTGLAGDPAVRVIVLTGANPGVFMRHYSVPELLEMAAALRAAGARPGTITPYEPMAIDRCMALIEAMGKPVIAAINGECMGGAMELALCCDMRIAQAGAFRLGQLESLLGILPGAGGIQRLARVIGAAATMEHVLMGLPITPEEARRIGMVHEVVPDALADALARAKHLATIPAPVLAHGKTLAHATRTLPLDQGLPYERELFTDLVIRDESIAMMQAYVDGRYAFRPDGAHWQVTMPPAG